MPEDGPDNESLDAQQPEQQQGLTDNPDALNANSQQPQQQKPSSGAAELPKEGFIKRVGNFLGGFNMYLLGFIVLMIIAGIAAYVALQNDESSTINIEGQELSQEALQELLQTEQNVGDVNQTLTVEANAIFNGKILVKDNLDVAGSINVGGPLTLPGITVAGTSAFDEVEVSNNLSILGNASIQGTLTVQESFGVTGNLSVGGTISAGTVAADNLQFNGDLQIQRHIDTGGNTPGVSAGGSVGGGGTVSVSGTDAAGTVTINTGGGPGSGILASITFAASYNGTPHVVITPVGSSGASLDYYVTRTTSGFTIGTRNNASASTTYLFDYIVLE